MGRCPKEVRTNNLENNKLTTWSAARAPSQPSLVSEALGFKPSHSLVFSELVCRPHSCDEFEFASVFGGAVKFATSCNEEDIIEIVGGILKHIFGPSLHV
ncbi:hypothetical protein CK203_079303 [Vitis vinifera]|uniref:Uncharacterized protein n=1 Tax=Vitis vinifera TaxID=29760 RepID=A0A438DGJ0_VITVI|nr:hypothetical protein CK203_079303 [Vitis vinifera]